ncbi:MAG: tRNA lysidine(34) synthetase TilS [Candidatus Competibacteraceae bacterium]|nr:tRNA lysidine(34) synthetase TilS [Candidatus Competibacteraceae bacterium]
MTFADKFLLNWQQSFYFAAHQKILLAVSGGMDSVAMAHLFHLHQIPFGIAHVNYRLRKKDADQDAKFVEQLALTFDVPFYLLKPSMKKALVNNRDGLQQTARNIRYAWFDKLAKQHGYAFVATAHHANDSIETFFVNLLRGTGIEGLTGIPEKNNNRIRPLLFAFRNEIADFVTQHNIAFRTDYTNLETHYTRNLLRIEVIPKLADINPGFYLRMLKNIENLQAAKSLYTQALHRLKSELVHFDPTIPGYKLSMLEIAGRGIHSSTLFEILKEFGFHISQTEDMIQAIGGKNGLIFSSPDYDCITDRGFFLIRQKNIIHLPSFSLSSPRKGHWNQFSWHIISSKKHTPIHHPSVAELDLQKLQFPLTWRLWQSGDFIQPLGLKGRKKLSDLTTDHKLNRFQKEKLYVLQQADGIIVWVPGICISHQHKITPSSQRIFVCTLSNI